MRLWATAAKRRLPAVGIVLATVACGAGPEPSPVPAVTVLTIEPSPSCTIGDGGLPAATYAIAVQDQRSGNDWLFVENRDPGGPREQRLVLRLQSNNGALVGTISGPAIIETQAGRMTVYPDGAVNATAGQVALAGTFNGRLAAWLTVAGTVQACTAIDHRFRLPVQAVDQHR